MNNLFQLLRESWQVARRSKLLWLFSFAPILTGLILRIWNQEQTPGATPDLILSCSGLILVIFSFFTIWFNAYALPYCAGMAIQEKECAAIDVWNGFKANALRFLLLGLLSFFYALLLYILNSFTWRILTHTNESLNTIWRSVSLNLIFILFGGPILLSPYGLLFQKMGVFQSFINGFKVFAQNRITFMSIYAIPFITNIVLGILIVGVLAFNGQAINYENYNNIQMSSIYFSIVHSFFYFLITLIITAAFALLYFRSFSVKSHFFANYSADL
jgi:hypothetical protein